MEKNTFELKGLQFVILNESEVSVKSGEYSKLISIFNFDSDSVEYDGVKYKITEFGDEAFVGQEIPNIYIDSSIKRIGKRTFKGCTFDGNIFISGDTKIGEGAFQNGSNLRNFTYIGGKGVLTIEESTFENCTGPFSISFSGHIGTIKKNAFANAKISQITFPHLIDEIEGDAFKTPTPLMKVIFTGQIPKIEYNSFMKYINNTERWVCATAQAEQVFPLVQFIPSQANYESLKNYFYDIQLCFLPLKGSNTVNVPTGVKTLSKYAFTDVVVENEYPTLRSNIMPVENTSVQSIFLPDTIDELDRESFEGCKVLYNIDIENDKYSSEDGAAVYEIKEDGLSLLWFSPQERGSIELSDEVKSIESKAFYHSNLEEIVLPKGCYCSTDAFLESTEMSKIVDGNGVVYDAKGFEKVKSKLEDFKKNVENKILALSASPKDTLAQLLNCYYSCLQLLVNDFLRGYNAESQSSNQPYLAYFFCVKDPIKEILQSDLNIDNILKKDLEQGINKMNDYMRFPFMRCNWPDYCFRKSSYFEQLTEFEDLCIKYYPKFNLSEKFKNNRNY